MRLRIGRHIPRNLYLQYGPGPDDGDRDIGRVDTAGLALLITTAAGLLPECALECEEGCEAGPAHCWWLHMPSHMEGWHGPDECPWEALRSQMAAAAEESRPLRHPVPLRGRLEDGGGTRAAGRLGEDVSWEEHGGGEAGGCPEGGSEQAAGETAGEAERAW